MLVPLSLGLQLASAQFATNHRLAGELECETTYKLLSVRGNVDRTWLVLEDAVGLRPTEAPIWPWVKTQIVPPVNIPIPSKIPTKMEVHLLQNGTIGCDPQPYGLVCSCRTCKSDVWSADFVTHIARLLRVLTA